MEKTRTQLVNQLMTVFSNNFGGSSGAMDGGNIASGGDRLIAMEKRIDTFLCFVLCELNVVTNNTI